MVDGEVGQELLVPYMLIVCIHGLEILSVQRSGGKQQ